MNRAKAAAVSTYVHDTSPSIDTGQGEVTGGMYMGKVRDRFRGRGRNKGTSKMRLAGEVELFRGKFIVSICTGAN